MEPWQRAYLLLEAENLEKYKKAALERKEEFHPLNRFAYFDNWKAQARYYDTDEFSARRLVLRLRLPLQLLPDAALAKMFNLAHSFFTDYDFTALPLIQTEKGYECAFYKVL